MSIPTMKIEELVTDLRSVFIRHDRFTQLESEFDRLLCQRRAAMKAGSVCEANGLAVIGGSGSGKSTALRWLFAKHKDLTPLVEGVEQADVASFLIPSPATLKYVGLSCLEGLGYPMRRNCTAGYIWSLVQNSLHQRRTLFLHLDEAQDLHINQNKSERQAVVNTLKSLMQNRTWPTGLILSGMPSLNDLLNQDAQLARRISVLSFAPLDPATHLKAVRGLVNTYADAAKLPTNSTVQSPAFARRLLHAAAYEFGLVVELIIGAIEDALINNNTEFGQPQFAGAFRRRTACIDDLNPFIRSDFSAIDPRLVMADETDLGYKTSLPGQRI